jgi:uncharacterized protein YkwD
MEYVLSLMQIPESGSRHIKDFFAGFFEYGRDHFIPHSGNNYHPHVLGHGAMAGFAGLLVAMKIFVLSFAAFGPILPVFSSAITEDNIISLTNESRKEFGIGELKQNFMLDKAAQSKAYDMLKGGYFSHNTPQGKTPWTFIEAEGYNYLTAGENLAINFSEAEDVETAWMNSPGHKANILNKGFEEIGIGIAQGDFEGHNSVIVVQMFGTPVEQKITLSEKPTKVETVKAPKPENDLSLKGPLEKAIPLTFKEPVIEIQGSEILIKVETSSNAVKAMAIFGEKAVMLSPKLGNIWEGGVAVNTLAKEDANLTLKIFDIQGRVAQSQAAYFSGSTPSNFNVLGATAAQDKKIEIFGNIFSAKLFEQRFYLIFIAGILTSLVLAIGIKRHVQHLGMVANSGVVVVLAALLWMGS